MQLSGKQTTDVKVEVSNKELVEAIEKLYFKEYPKYEGYSHIKDDGYWYHYSFENGHTGDVEYKRGEKATQEHITDYWKNTTFLTVLDTLKRSNL